MFLPRDLATQIATIFYKNDIICREELWNNTIVAERDYVSALTTGIRRELTPTSSLLVHNQTLPGALERRFGADGIIIVKYENKFKIALFESKWPRAFRNPVYTWDYLSHNYSHFTDQLNRQENYINYFAFWEMFFFEGPSGIDSPPFDPLGSSIVLQPDALIHSIDNDLTNIIWTTNHLRTLLRHQGRNLFNVMFLFLTCRIGKAYKLRSKAINQYNYLEFPELDFNIPIPLKIDNFKFNEGDPISSFMKNNGFESYYFIDSDEIKNEKYFRK